MGSIEDTQFDHRPALVARPFIESAGDFDPPQNDPNFMDALHADCHLYRTTGRKPGASKTVTTRGSDVGEAKRVKHVQATHAAFVKAVEVTAEEKPAKPPSRWPKRKMQSRNNFRRVA